MFDLNPKTGIEATKSAPETVMHLSGRGAYVPQSQYGPSDEFCLKFGGRPYLDGHWRLTEFHPARQIAVGKRHLDEVIERAGGVKKILSARDQEKQLALQSEDSKLAAKLSEISFKNATQIFLLQHGSIDLTANLALPNLQSKAQVADSIVVARNAIHARRRELMTEAYGILAPAMERASAAAREICVELDAKERAEAKKYGIDFAPSAILQSFAYLAIVIIPRPLANYTSGNGFISLATDLIGSWTQSIQGPPAELPPDVQGCRYRAPGELSPTQLRTISDAKEVQARQSASHAEQLQRINEANDAIRNQPLK